MCILPGLFLFSGSVMSDSLRPHGLQPGRLLCPWNSPSKNTGLGCHALLRGDLPNPGIKPASLTSPALVGGLFTTSTTWEAPLYNQLDVKCFNPYGFFKYLDENSTVGSLLLIVNYSVKPQISLILKIKDDPTILKNFSRFHLV